MSVKIEDVVKEKPQAKADTIVIEDYDSDPKIPIYSTRASGLSSEELIHLLLEKQNKRFALLRGAKRIEYLLLNERFF
jgi:hypothetical protein